VAAGREATAVVTTCAVPPLLRIQYLSKSLGLVELVTPAFGT